MLQRSPVPRGKGVPDNVGPTVGGAKHKKTKEAIGHTAALANLPPVLQAMADKPFLNTKVARKKPGKGKRKTTGLEPPLELRNLGKEGYYIKPDIPRRTPPHGGDPSKNI